MAHAVEINSLTEKLVKSVTRYDPKKNWTGLKNSKDAAIKQLRHHNFGRTNQFAVAKTLDGLVEKFEILNKDDLAAALRSRLKRLSDLKHVLEPEFLSLLLDLSDKPAEKTRVDQLEFAHEPEQPYQLTWEEILAHDPLDDDSLWEEDYDQGILSDEDDDDDVGVDIENDGVVYVDGQNVSDLARDITLPAEDETCADLEQLKIRIDENSLNDVQKARWKDETDMNRHRAHTTEAELIRSVIHATLGLPTSLFNGARPIENPFSWRGHNLVDTSTESMDDIVERLATLASDLSVLRNFAKAPQGEPLLRSLANALESRIWQFDSVMAEKEKALAVPKGPTLVSILGLYASIENESRHLLALKPTVLNAKTLRKGETYRILDDLYGLICTTQGICDEAGFEFFAQMFFECLETFLHPIATWMECGEVQEGLEMILLSSTNRKPDPGSYWNKAFSVACVDGERRIPGFALEASAYIFSSGKSVAFLKFLGVETNLENTRKGRNERNFTLEDIQDIEAGSKLLSFDALFKDAFHNWVKTRHRLPSKVLLDHLVEQCGLLKTIDALEYLFLSKDGAAFQDFADRLFSRLDGKKRTWNDPIAVEDIARNYLTRDDSILPSSIEVEQAVAIKDARKRTVEALSTIKLNYKYSFPAQNVIPRSCIRTYQRAFCFLLQIYRCSSLLSLHRPRAMNRWPSSSTSSSSKNQVEPLACLLHHRLLHLITTIRTHFTQNAIEMLSAELHHRVKEAQDVDTIIAAHKDFIHALEKRLLFSKEAESARQALLKMLELACAFCELLGSMDFAHRSSRNKHAETNERVGLVSDTESDAGSDDIPQANKPQPDSHLLFTRIQQMRAQHANLLSIIVAALRTGARLDAGDETWEQLAEYLEWNWK